MGANNELRLLVIECDAIARRAIDRILSALTMELFVVTRVHASSIPEALAVLGADAIDVVLVREAQGAFDALEVLRGIRRQGDHTPVAVYDPLGRTEIEIATLLNAGADDFIAAPALRPNELLARLRALQRRRPFANERQIIIGEITIDIERRHVLVQGMRVDVTLGEYRLLTYLARRAGAYVTRRELYLAVLETQDIDNRSNALAAAISRLRRKLGSASAQLVAIRASAIDSMTRARRALVSPSPRRSRLRSDAEHNVTSSGVCGPFCEGLCACEDHVCALGWVAALGTHRQRRSGLAN